MCKNSIKEYIFLWWDGVSFFGPDHTKLQRLNGIPPRWFDKFKSFAWFFPKFVMLALIAFVIGNEFKDVGEVKSQVHSNIKQKEYFFEVKDHLPVIFSVSLNKTQLINAYNR